MPAERGVEESHVDLSPHLAASPKVAVIRPGIVADAFATPAANDPHGMPSPVAEAEPTRPSWRAPEPPLPTKAELAAPRVPSFEVSVRPVRPLPNSLGPGASVWPGSKSGPSRSVPLVAAVAASLASLVVGSLLGVLLSDSLAPAAPVVVEGVKPPVVVPPLPAVASESVTTPDAPAAPVAAAPAEPVGSPAHAEGAPVTPVSRARNQRPMPASVRTEAALPSEEEGALAERLSAGQIQRTVQRYQPSVRHGCWNRQLEHRDPSAKSAAKVNIAIVIAPSGKVESAVAAADPPGYPGLGACISQKVQGWTFPKALLPTRAQLPFSFAAQ